MASVAHIICSAFFVQIALRQSTSFLCIQPSLQFVVELKKTMKCSILFKNMVPSIRRMRLISRFLQFNDPHLLLPTEVKGTVYTHVTLTIKAGKKDADKKWTCQQLKHRASVPLNSSSTTWSLSRWFVLFGLAGADTSFFSGKSWLTMGESDTSSTFTCSSLLTSPDPDEYDEHIMWNPMLGLFCHVQVGVFMEAYFEMGKNRAFLSFFFGCTM